MNPFIVWVEDTEKGSRDPCAFVRSPVRMGRSPRNDITLARPFVSEFHGVLDFDSRGVLYTDLGSTNGSEVDGVRVEPRRPVPLRPATVIRIGTLCLTFERAREGETAAQGAGPERVQRGRMSRLMLDLAQAPFEAGDDDWLRVLFPGAIIGRFELVREIGRGGFGVVFEARDRELGRLVAFKAVRPGRFSQVRLRKEQLQREAEAVAQLSHPNVVQIFDIGRCESGPYLILELLRGRTLHERIREGPLSPGTALDVAIDVAWALEHAHAAGLVHRDLKPSNVFLCDGGRVKVLDFGIAHVFGDGEPRAMGTPAYMAPEQWRGGAQDARTDVFGAAAMLFESLTGKLPYDVTSDHSGVLDEGARPAVGGKGIPPRLEELLRAALDPDPQVRPRDGSAWLEALLAIRAEASPATPAPATASGVASPGVPIAWIVLVVAAAAGLWALLSR